MKPNPGLNHALECHYQRGLWATGQGLFSKPATSGWSKARRKYFQTGRE